MTVQSIALRKVNKEREAQVSDKTMLIAGQAARAQLLYILKSGGAA